MRQRADGVETLRRSPEFATFERARALRVAAEAIEAQALRALRYDAQGAGVSLRPLARLTGVPHATLARRSVQDALASSHSDGPPEGYDEAVWIAAEDIAKGREPHTRCDRAPWRVEWQTESDGTRTRRVTLLAAGVGVLATDDGYLKGSPPVDLESSAPVGVEVLQGITAAEYELLMSRGLDGDESRRIATRLARAVLRTLHPDIVRTPEVVECATERVLTDVPGAMVCAGLASLDDDADSEWQRDVRTRRERSYYLKS